MRVKAEEIKVSHDHSNLVEIVQKYMLLSSSHGLEKECYQMVTGILLFFLYLLRCDMMSQSNCNK